MNRVLQYIYSTYILGTPKNTTCYWMIRGRDANGRVPRRRQVQRQRGAASNRGLTVRHRKRRAVNLKHETTMARRLKKLPLSGAEPVSCLAPCCLHLKHGSSMALLLKKKKKKKKERKKPLVLPFYSRRWTCLLLFWPAFFFSFPFISKPPALNRFPSIHFFSCFSNLFPLSLYPLELC